MGEGRRNQTLCGAGAQRSWPRPNPRRLCLIARLAERPVPHRQAIPAFTPSHASSIRARMKP